MSSILYIAPLLGAKNKYFYYVFGAPPLENCGFVGVEGEKIQQLLSSCVTRICFDYLGHPIDIENFNTFYDVKILCGLAGMGGNSLMEFARASPVTAQYLAEYEDVTLKMNNVIRSYKKSKILYQNYPFDSLFPDFMLLKFMTIQAKIVHDLFLKQQKETVFYEKLLPSIVALAETAKEPVYINASALAHDYTHFSKLLKRLRPEGKLYLRYNFIGAKTGRLSFAPGTVNLYILPKSLRAAIVAPEENSIVQIDFKSFQPRLAIFSTNNIEFKKKFQNIDDIYSVFDGDRETNKISFLAWMFSNGYNHVFEYAATPILDLRKNLFAELKINGKIINPFGRSIHYDGQEENVTLQNYVTSVEVDVILSLVMDIHLFLKNKKSKIAFPFHDSLVLYVHKKEMELVEKIKSIMEMKCRDMFGAVFPVSVKIGDNFGEMKTFKQKGD
jgi:hypothetical protein